jgi:hypothetical protein
MGSWNGQTYLGYGKRISKVFGFCPKLVEIGQFFRLFTLFTQRAVSVEDNPKIKFVIGSSMASF